MLPGRFKRDLSTSSALAAPQYLRRSVPRVATNGAGVVDITWAWQGFLLFAIGEPRMLQAYQSATGNPPLFGDEDVLLDFTFWVTLRHWGTEGVPEKFLEDARARYGDVEDEDENQV